MDLKLHLAWSELDRLKMEERATLEKLLRIRREIKAHKARIGALVKERPLSPTVFLMNYFHRYSLIASQTFKTIVTTNLL